MAPQQGDSSGVPSQPTLRLVFDNLRACLDEFERQTLASFRTLQEQYEEKDDKLSYQISNIMDSHDKNACIGDRRKAEEALQSLLVQRSTFRAEHEANRAAEEETCEKLQRALLRPLQTAIFNSFPQGSWSGVTSHEAENVQGDADGEIQPPNQGIQQIAEETQKELRSNTEADNGRGAITEDNHYDIGNDECSGGAQNESAHNEGVGANEEAQFDSHPGHNAGENNVEINDDSQQQIEGCGEDFDESESELDDDEESSASSGRVDGEVATIGTKRPLRNAGSSQLRKKPRQSEKQLPIKGKIKDKTIKYRDVYSNTLAGRKETIVQFPANTGRWYIIRCEEHGLKFRGSNPLMDAAGHLGSLQHDKFSRAYGDVIEQMGIRVKYCRATLAEENNNAIVKKAAQQSPAKKVRRATASRGRTKKRWQNSRNRSGRMGSREEVARRRSDTEDASSVDLWPGWRRQGSVYRFLPQTSRRADDNGKERPYVRYQPGDICVTYYENLIPVLILPLEDMIDIGISGDLDKLCLSEDMPGCCTQDPITGMYGWNEGYEDGGEFESYRQHPVLCLTGRSLERCPAMWVLCSDLERFDLSDPISKMNDNYWLVRRLLKKIESNRLASSRNAAAEQDSQHSPSQGNIEEDSDDETHARLGADVEKPQQDEPFSQEDRAEESRGDRPSSYEDQRNPVGENQDDDLSDSDEDFENFHDNDPSNSNGKDLRAPQQNGDWQGESQLRESQQGGEVGVCHPTESEDSQDLMQQVSLNSTSTLSNNRTIKESSLNCTTTFPNETAIQKSFLGHTILGDEAAPKSAGEKRSRSPPRTITRAVSIQTISSDSGDEVQHLREDVFGNPRSSTTNLMNIASDCLGNLLENLAATESSANYSNKTGQPPSSGEPLSNSVALVESDLSQNISTVSHIPAQQDTEIARADPESSSAGTGDARNGPRLVGEGPWSPSALRAIICTSEDASATATQTQPMDPNGVDPKSSLVGISSFVISSTSNQDTHKDHHRVDKQSICQPQIVEGAQNEPQRAGSTHSQTSSEVPSAIVEVEALPCWAPEPSQRQIQTRALPQMQSQPRIESQSCLDAQFQAQTQSPLPRQSQSQPHIQAQHQTLTQPQARPPLQPQFQRQIQSYPQAQSQLRPLPPLQTPSQPRIQPQPLMQCQSPTRQGPEQPYSPVRFQLQERHQPLPGLHPAPGASLKLQTQMQAQTQSQNRTQSPTTNPPKSHPFTRPRARRTPSIQFRLVQPRRAQTQTQTSPVSSTGSPTTSTTNEGQADPATLLIPGTGANVPHIHSISSSSSSPSMNVMGGLSSPEDVLGLFGPPKQTPLPLIFENPMGHTNPESEAERVLRKNWPMFSPGPLRDELEKFVQQNNRPPGVEGLRNQSEGDRYCCPFCQSKTAQWGTGLELINHLDSIHPNGVASRGMMSFRAINSRLGLV